MQMLDKALQEAYSTSIGSWQTTQMLMCWCRYFAAGADSTVSRWGATGRSDMRYEPRSLIWTNVEWRWIRWVKLYLFLRVWS
jgi:hypothetical protein